MKFEEHEGYGVNSEITADLWMGGELRASELRAVQRIASEQFGAVVSLDSSLLPVGQKVKELRFGFPDSELDPQSTAELERIADWAFLEWKSGERVLIRCQAGLNRSGLVTALVLLRDGIKVNEALNLIRSKRGPYALSNPSFVAYLESHPRATGAKKRR